MTRVEELELGPRALHDLRRVRVHRHRQERHRLDGVELAQCLGHRGDGIGALTDLGRELLQDADDLAPLGVLQLDDVVVELDRGQRLDEQARARARAAVDDARQLPLLLGLQQQHVAVVARGDDAVLQQALALGAAQVAFHHARQLGAQPHERAPQLGEPRRGVVAELARGQQGPPDGDRHGARVLDARSQARERGSPVDAGDPTRDLDAALDERGQVGERPRLEVAAPDPGAGERLLGVREVVVRLAAELPEERNTLARPRQGAPDGLRLDQRSEPFEPGTPRTGAHLLEQKGENAIELQCFK